MRLPRIFTFADPALTESAAGRLHDAAWLVETRLVEIEAVIVLDATVAAFVQHVRMFGELERALAGLRRIALVGETQNEWVFAWQPELVMPIIAPSQTTLLEACQIGQAPTHGAVIVVSGLQGVLTPGSLATLRQVRPDVRVFAALCVGVDRELQGGLADGDGGYLRIDGAREPDAALHLMIGASSNVELTVHAECRGRDPAWRAVVRAPLNDVDRLRVDAITSQVDDPVFVVEATVRSPALPWPVSTLHRARRREATPPSEDQLVGVPLRPNVELPTCTAMASGRHDREVMGEVSFDLGRRIERVPLIPAMRIETEVGQVALEVVEGRVEITGRGGIVKYHGSKGGFVGRGATILLARGETIELGEAIIRVDLQQSTLASIPRTIVTGDVRRSPERLFVDGQPLELVQRGRAYELRNAGRWMTIRGTLRGDRAELADLWWLVRMTQGQTVRAASRTAIQLALVDVTGTAWGSVNRHINGTVVFDLVDDTVTLDATYRSSVDS